MLNPHAPIYPLTKRWQLNLVIMWQSVGEFYYRTNIMSESHSYYKYYYEIVSKLN